ncbi:MAG: NADH-quinone oxidoreductase subunit NuoG [Alphaproteobacteria bacterium]|nr:NADH-quinone oxidoreductase subunit NuoG [Alphaproteobacteria bacterium]
MTTAPTQKAPEFPPAPEGMVNVVIDGVHHIVPRTFTVMQACTQAEKEIPHFCYHERLSIAGNCRMCLVEVVGAPKPVASCHWPVAEGMKVNTQSQITIEARKGTMELLLANHPLDCPICDQGGECGLQDQAVAYGSDRSHFEEMKRAVDDKDIGSKIKTVMTRCIHCTRCVRFATEIAGVEEFGATGRGEQMQIGTYVEQALQSELAGNMIDLCPVGALTSRPYAYTARPWELKRASSVDVLDAISAPVFVDTRAGQVMRVLPQENDAINEEWLTDIARFSYDALSANRLTTPLIHGQPASWPEAFAAVQNILAKAEGKVGVVAGDQTSAETAFSLQQFAAQVLKTDYVTALPTGREGGLPFTLGMLLKEFDKAEAVLLLGCNPRREAPLLNVRLRRGVLKRGLKVYSVGAVADLTYRHTHLGDTVAALEDFKSDKPLHIIVGAQALNRSDAAALLAAASQRGTVHVLEESCGRITAQAMGLTASAADLAKQWQSGKLAALWLHGDDTLTAEELKAGEGSVIYVGTHHTRAAKAAEVCLPAAAWAEAPGLFMNAEARVQEAQAACAPPLQAKETWKIYRALSEDLGATLPWNTLAQLREYLAAAHPAFAPAQRNQPQAQPLTLPKTTGKLLTKKFTEAIPAYYLRTTYLQQSAWMHRMQAEQGTAHIQAQGKKVA